MENSLVNVDIAVAQYIKSKNRVLKYNKEHPEKLAFRMEIVTLINPNAR